MNFGFVNNQIVSIPQINDLDFAGITNSIEFIYYENSKMDTESIINVLSIVKSNDLIITSSLINFSLNLADSIEIISQLTSKKIYIKSILDDYNSPDVRLLPEKTDYTLNLSFNTIKKFNYFSKNEILIKQKKGIEKAKKEGKYQNHGGSEAFQTKNFPFFYRYFKEWQNNLITKSEFAKLLGISRPTLDKLLKTVKIESGEKNDEIISNN